MKAYTDIEQSKKLAEILPIESADMWFHPYPNDEYWYDVPNIGNADLKYNQLLCWSLAALLSVLPDSIYDNTDEYSQLEFSKISVAYHDMNDGIKVGSIKDNLVDACVDMILKLHKQKLL